MGKFFAMWIVDTSFLQCLSLSLTFIIMKPFKTQVTVIELTVNSSFTRLYTTWVNTFLKEYSYICAHIFSSNKALVIK